MKLTIRSLQTWLFLLIILLAVVLRFAQLGRIPIALNRDEASLGFTAWSILHHGADEHGVVMPLNIQSFGDWKLPLYVYTVIPFIQLFGLSEWTVRLPSALAGVGIVVLTFVLVRLLLESELIKQKHHQLKWLPLLSSFLVAISPWAVHVSRIAYEANLALFLFLLGLCLWLMAVQREFTVSKELKQFLPWFFPLSVFCFGLTFFGYHSFQVFTPLVSLFLAVRYWPDIQKIWEKDKPVFFTTTLIILATVSLFLIGLTSKANQTKFSGLSIFEVHQYDQALFDQRQLTTELPSIMSKAYANKYRLLMAKFWQNFESIVNPKFLFISGGTHGSHNFPGIGNFYAFELITLSLGFYVLISQQKKWMILLAALLIAGLAAPLITIEAAHSIRALPLLVPLEIVSALGLIQLFVKIKIHAAKFSKLALGVTTVVILYSFFYFLITYFVLFPKLGQQNWAWYMKPLVQYVNENGAGREVYMQGESSSPYIWFCFYSPAQCPPGEIQFYPATNEGFIHVKQINHLHFGTVDWENLPQDKSVLLLLRKDEVPEALLKDQHFQLANELISIYSDIQYTIITYDPS